MKGQLPDFYETLTDAQLKRKHPLPSLPEVYWVNGSGVAHTKATDDDDARHARHSIRSRHYLPWQIIQAWKDLARLGYIPTSRENYVATIERLHSPSYRTRKGLED